jgi:hypothetical protein
MVGESVPAQQKSLVGNLLMRKHLMGRLMIESGVAGSNPGARLSRHSPLKRRPSLPRNRLNWVRRRRPYGILAMLVSGICSAASLPNHHRNLDKYSLTALRRADSALLSARVAFRADDPNGVSTAMTEFVKYVELAYTCLRESGKNPSERPKYFKRAEIHLRKLSRQLDYLEVQMGSDDRPALKEAKTTVQQIDDVLIISLVGNKENKGYLDALAH